MVWEYVHGTDDVFIESLNSAFAFNFNSPKINDHKRVLTNIVSLHYGFSFFFLFPFFWGGGVNENKNSVV